MKITLTKVTKLTQDKQGNPLTTKAGKPYTRLLINCNEHGSVALSGFDNQATQNWKVGDTVEVEIEEVKVGDKTYLNFKTPNKQAQDDKIDKILVELGLIRQSQERIISLLPTIPSRETARPSLDEYVAPEGGTQ